MLAASNRATAYTPVATDRNLRHWGLRPGDLIKEIDGAIADRPHTSHADISVTRYGRSGFGHRGTQRHTGNPGIENRSTRHWKRPNRMMRQQKQHRRATLFMALTLILVATLPIAVGQDTAPQGMITPNYKEADLRKIVEAVGAVTNKTIIIDPRVSGAKVTMISSTPMSPEAFYEAFLSVLEVHQYAAVTSGDIIKIIPNATARQYAGPLGSGSAQGPDDIITQVVQVNNVGAAQLVPILRPLVPQYGHLVAHPGSNMLIISDRAANVGRMVNIIRRIDQASDEEIEVVSLEHASAAEVVRVMTALMQQPRADGAPVYNKSCGRRSHEQRP